MFEVGDIVEVFVDLPDIYPITRIGSYGAIIHSSPYDSFVDFEVVDENYSHIIVNRYFINNAHLRLKETLGMKSKVERKIAAIYARQHRKTGYAYLL